MPSCERSRLPRATAMTTSTCEQLVSNLDEQTYDAGPAGAAAAADVAASTRRRDASSRIWPSEDSPMLVSIWPAALAELLRGTLGRQIIENSKMMHDDALAAVGRYPAGRARQRHERAVHPPADRHQLARAASRSLAYTMPESPSRQVDVAVDHKADERGSLLIFVLDVELRPSGSRLVVVVLVTARVLARRLVAAPSRAPRAAPSRAARRAHRDDRGDREAAPAAAGGGAARAPSARRSGRPAAAMMREVLR